MAKVVMLQDEISLLDDLVQPFVQSKDRILNLEWDRNPSSGGVLHASEAATLRCWLV
jgi:hypothetical protein